MTLHLGESLAVRNAIKKHQRISQIGTQHHARDAHHRVVEYVRSGSLGPIGVARTFNVMNQTPRGIGTGGYKAPHEGIDWEMWCGPRRSDGSTASWSPMHTTIVPGWITAAAGRPATART